MNFRIMEKSGSKWLYNKKVVTTISIVCAVIFWGIINISESPTIAKDIHNVPVQISVEGTVAESMGLDVISGGEDRTVTVMVSGPRYIVAGLTADDITVTASMDNVTTAGNQQISLVATRASNKVGYSIIGVSPSTITLMVDNFDTRTFDVEVRAVGAAAAEGLICDTPVVSADKYAKISVSGPKIQLDRLEKVVAEAQVNATLSETKTFDATLKFYDASGNEMDKTLFTIEQPTVNITVPILKSKEVPLKATFKNAPAAYSAGGLNYTLSVRKVTVLGRADEIDALESITLAPIDFEKISDKNTRFSCVPDIPNGMRLAEDIPQVEVTITSAVQVKTVSVSKFRPEGLADGLKMSVTEKTPKEITICTAGSSLSSLENNSITAVVDLSGYSAGEYNVAMRIEVNGRDDIWAVAKETGYTLRIKIS